MMVLKQALPSVVLANKDPVWGSGSFCKSSFLEKLHRLVQKATFQRSLVGLFGGASWPSASPPPAHLLAATGLPSAPPHRRLCSAPPFPHSHGWPPAAPPPATRAAGEISRQWPPLPLRRGRPQIHRRPPQDPARRRMPPP